MATRLRRATWASQLPQAGVLTIDEYGLLSGEIRRKDSFVQL